ncbi:ATP-binding protein [Nitrospira sp. M1]
MNRRILIIDDNQAIHEDFRKILGGDSRSDSLAEAQKILFGDNQDAETAGRYEIECADQGQIGLALVQKAVRENRPFAMAFVDMRMPPGWDGIETIEYIWKVDSALQMVICTAYSDHQWDQIMQRLGHSEKLLILRKPFDMIEVQQLADSLTTKWNVAHRVNERMASCSQAEQALRHVLAETESLVTAIPSILIGLDEGNRVIRWNAVAEQVFEVPSSIILGNALQLTDIQWDWDALMTAVQDCREQRQPVRVPTLRYLDPSRTERIVDMTVSPIRGETDTPVGIVMLGQVCESGKGLSASPAGSQAMTSSVHRIAENIRFLETSFHDIQKLLDAYGKLFQQPDVNGTNHHISETVSRVMNDIDFEGLLREIPAVFTNSLEGTDRVKEFVGTLHESSYSVPEEKVTIDLKHSLQSAISLLPKKWLDIADIVTDFEGDLPQIFGTPTQLIRVWCDFMIHAAQAIQQSLPNDSAEKGTITISTRKTHEWVEIRIADTGTRVPPAIPSKVGDRSLTLTRVEAETSPWLAFAHSTIVHTHGGLLSFESLSLDGTTFIVRFPLGVGVDRKARCT